MPLYSLLVPTYNERKNIALFAAILAKAIDKK